MPTNVYELTQSGRNLVVDTHLIFPNVLTCVAITARSGTQLYGVHATIADRSRMPFIRGLLTAAGCVTPQIYVVGPVGGFHLMALLPLGAVSFYQCEGGIDVEAKLDGDGVSFGTRPNTGGGFTAIDPKDFVS